MQKYFIPKEKLKLGIIDTSDAFHITSVMRSRIGDEILVSDCENTYRCKITSLKNDLVTFEILYQEIGNKELPVFVSIFQGYPKGDKMEEIIKHGVELGAYEFYPTIMKRSVFKLEEKKKESKLVRFNKISKEAAEQSFREYIPKVCDIPYLKNIDFSKYDKKILCFEEAYKNGDLYNFKTIISSLKKDDKIAIVIGPEGGIDKTEYDYLLTLGFIPASLGPRILRTETAVFYCLSSISYEMELKKSE